MTKISNNQKFSHNIINDQRNHILLIWDSAHWSNIILHTNDQYISRILHIVNDISVLCTTMYAFNEDVKRKKQWHYVTAQSQFVNLPQIVAGDFGAILSPNDRTNNGIFNSMGDQDFIDCVALSKLVEPDFLGNFLHGKEVIYSLSIVRYIVFLLTIYGWKSLITLVLILIITL